MVIPFATTSFRTTVHFFVGTELSAPSTVRSIPPSFLSTYFIFLDARFSALISSPYFILVLRFEIYDDARTRALASSDYVYDFIEGSWACGKCSCTFLYI